MNKTTILPRVSDIRDRNRKSVLEAVRREGIASRTEIGRMTGLSAATVSAITSDFLEEGVLLRPASAVVAALGRGRPTVALQLNSQAAMICSIYFQLNLITATMVDYSGNTIVEHTVEILTPDITASEIQSALISCIADAVKLSNRASTNLRRISVGFQGVVDVDGKSVIWTPICAERNIPIQQWLEAHFHVPTRVANDCDMIVQALNWKEPDRYDNNFAAILLSHGVGMGLFLHKRVSNGIRSSGNEFGHMNYIPNGALCRCGNHGCIEAYAGDYAISRHARGEAEDTPPSDLLDLQDLEAIATSAREGDQKSIAAIEKAGEAIGAGLANLFALLDPFPIVLVGRGASAFDLMESKIRNIVESAPGSGQPRLLEIACIPDETSLVREGCAISALLMHDDEMARHRAKTTITEPMTSNVASGAAQ